MLHGLKDIVMEDTNKKDRRNSTENCQTTRNLSFFVCHRAPESFAACLGSLETNICKVGFRLQYEKKCKLLLSVSDLSQIVQS